MSQWNLPGLSPELRQRMLSELLSDRVNGTPYLGKHLSDLGKAKYFPICEDALARGTPESFARALEPVPGALWITHYIKKNGVQSRVSSDAAIRLGGGEFNRYYMRAVCLEAIERECRVVVYRARAVTSPRFEGPAEGTVLNPTLVLVDLRNDYDIPSRTGMPHGPNSGLSLRLAS